MFKKSGYRHLATIVAAALAAPAAVASSFPLMEKLSVETMTVAARTDDAINAATAAVSLSTGHRSNAFGGLSLNDRTINSLII